MASYQCHKPAYDYETCHQQKYSEQTGRFNGTNNHASNWTNPTPTQPTNQTHWSTQTRAQPYYNQARTNQTHWTTTPTQTYPGYNCASSMAQTHTHCAEKTHMGHQAYSHTHAQTQHPHASNGSVCHGKTKKKERKMFQMFNDGFSGNDSCSDGSDNEGCNTRCMKKK